MIGAAFSGLLKESLMKAVLLHLAPLALAAASQCVFADSVTYTYDPPFCSLGCFFDD